MHGPAENFCMGAEREPSSPGASSRAGMLRIFVKRGAIWRFHRLTRDARSLPISVEWDRRQEDRRSTQALVSDDQRREDRRGEVPFTWDKAEFVVVDDRTTVRNR